MLEAIQKASPGDLSPGGLQNRLRQRLEAREFAITFELVTPRAEGSLDENIAGATGFVDAPVADGRVAAVAVTDRVKSDFDHDSGAAGTWVATRGGLQPLVHWAGKDRTPRQLAGSLTSLQAAGLENVLFLTGDRVERDSGNRQVEYLDSVNAIVQARRLVPEVYIGAVVSSFKYREESCSTSTSSWSRRLGPAPTSSLPK